MEFSQEDIDKRAKENYSVEEPWPEDDEWHKVTLSKIKKYVKKELSKYDSMNAVILNAGSGGTTYPCLGKMIHLDIVDNKIKHFDDFIVSSIDNIPLPDNSIDIVICVGSVLNYADGARSITEFSRILKIAGIMILEFERSNSAEFLFHKEHNRLLFTKEYEYNKQKHLLWMYSEQYILKLLKACDFKIIHKKRFHTLSSLFYRFRMMDQKAAKFACYDGILSGISYFLAHNCILTAKKIPNER